MTWPTPEPDPACKNLKGPLAGLGSPFKTERENAVQAVAAAGDASVGSSLINLLRNARFTTAEAAGLALAQMKGSGSAHSAALKGLVDDPALAMTRFGVALHAWHGCDPEGAVGWLRQRLNTLVETKDNDEHLKLVNVLRDHRFLDSALVEAAAQDLASSLVIADAATLNALGHVLVTLCEEPELLVPAIDPLTRALKRVDSDGCYSATLALRVGLEACTDTALQQKASDFALWELSAAVSSGSDYRMKSVAGLLRACPRPMVADKTLHALDGKRVNRELNALRGSFEGDS